MSFLAGAVAHHFFYTLGNYQSSVNVIGAANIKVSYSHLTLLKSIVDAES